MLCGETLCGDKFLFSFLPLHIATSMSMHFNNRVRKPVDCIDTCIYTQRRKRKYSLELDADWLAAMVVQLSIMYQQKKAAWPYRDPKSHPKIPRNVLQNSKYFYEIPKFIFRIHEFFSKNKKYFAKFEKIRKNSKKNCKKPKNFVKIRKKIAKNKTHVFPMGKTKKFCEIGRESCRE